LDDLLALAYVASQVLSGVLAGLPPRLLLLLLLLLWLALLALAYVASQVLFEHCRGCGSLALLPPFNPPSSVSGILAGLPPRLLLLLLLLWLALLARAFIPQ
jgi:hypothetical protein